MLVHSYGHFCILGAFNFRQYIHIHVDIMQNCCDVEGTQRGLLAYTTITSCLDLE